MPKDKGLGPLGFLHGDPAPVGRGQSNGDIDADRLPKAVVDRLMQLDGVDGVWVERDEDGQRVVVLHYSRPGPAPHLPSHVEGLVTRVVGHTPIRAQR